MLGKLLKYDLRAVGKYWWMLMVAILGLFSVGGVSFGLVLLISEHLYEPTVTNNELLFYTLELATIFLNVTFIASLVGIGICCFAVSVLICVRYFKHLFTDEGYLTFTLPASRGQIFNSKVLSAALWSFFTSNILTIGAFFMMTLMFFTSNSPEVSAETIESFAKFMLDIPFAQWLWIVAWLIIAALITVASFFLTPCAAYFCITLGATVFKRAKLVGAIGTYVLMEMLVQSAIKFLSGGIIFYLTICSVGLIDIFSKATELGINATITAFLLIIMCVVATLAAFFYSITRNILERKLNLA